MHKTNYILVTGGVISGVGKGVITSSIAALIEAQGHKVDVMKIDPYLNFDSGTMRPTEHGEVFVTPDGFETDQDLGNYTRFTGINFSRLNSVTGGQIFRAVLDRERAGEYKGKCVEMFPDVPNEIIRRIYEARDRTKPDFLVIELGGTAGEDQQKVFYSAIAEMQYRNEDIRHVHVAYAPVPGKLGEAKTKPIVESIVRLNESALRPDFIFVRSEKGIDTVRRDKISRNCRVDLENVISAPDVDLIYSIPVSLQEQRVDYNLMKSFGFDYNEDSQGFAKWKDLANKIQKGFDKTLHIAMVGKYFDTGNFTLRDSYLSVIESLNVAAWNNGVDIEINAVNSKDIEDGKMSVTSLSGYDGICVPGGYGDSGVKGILEAIRFSRESKTPYLGLCYGLQQAVIEYSRNVLGLDGANTTEIDSSTPHPVVHILPEQADNIASGKMGNSQRLGDYRAMLTEGSLVHSLYGSSEISETHRHRYEVNREYVQRLVDGGLVVSGKNLERNLVEFIELPVSTHPFFVATQAHPEFKSRFLKPAPLFDGFVKAAIRK